MNLVDNLEKYISVPIYTDGLGTDNKPQAMCGIGGAV